MGWFTWSNMWICSLNLFHIGEWNSMRACPSYHRVRPKLHNMIIFKISIQSKILCFLMNKYVIELYRIKGQTITYKFPFRDTIPHSFPSLYVMLTNQYMCSDCGIVSFTCIVSNLCYGKGAILVGAIVCVLGKPFHIYIS